MGMHLDAFLDTLQLTAKSTRSILERVKCSIPSSSHDHNPSENKLVLTRNSVESNDAVESDDKVRLRDHKSIHK